MNDPANSNVRPFAELGLDDLEQVGGKNSSLGEMVSNLSELGVNVPDGFATTADAYRRFIGDTGLAEEISGKLKGLDTDDTRALAEVGQEIREAVATRTSPRTSRPTSGRRTTSWWPGATRCPSPYGPARPPRTSPTRRSPVSRRPS